MRLHKDSVTSLLHVKSTVSGVVIQSIFETAVFTNLVVNPQRLHV